MSAPATVIVYHAVGPCPPGAEQDALYVDVDRFESQMAFLARNRHVVSLDTVVAGASTPGKPMVAITFDDGFASAVDNGLPILEHYGFPSTAFVTTRWLEGAGRPDAALSGDELMTEDDVATLHEHGVEIGSHGHTHADVGQLGAATIEADLRASMDRIEAITGRRPRYLAWPYGRTSQAGIEAAEAAGFEAAFTTDLPTEGTFAITRVQVYRPDGRTLFSLKTSGRYVALRRHAVVAGAYSVLEPAVSRLRR